MSYAPAKKRVFTPQDMQNNPKDVEAFALLEAAKRLQEVLPIIESGQKFKERDPVFEALQFNSKLWTIFQTELFKEKGAMPNDQRKIILEIARFMDKSMVGLLKSPDIKTIEAIIDINRNIAAGLLKKDQDQPQSAPLKAKEVKAQQAPQQVAPRTEPLKVSA